MHRIGRTGRAGRTGKAFTIAATDDDKKYLAAIAKLTGQDIPPAEGVALAAGEGATSEAERPAKSKSDKQSSSKSKTKNAAETDKVANRGGLDDNTKSSTQKRRHDNFVEGEKRPPAWTGGNSFKDADSIPDFLKSA